MRTLPALICCLAALACGGESVGPEELDFRIYDVPREAEPEPPYLDATISAGIVHLTGALPQSTCGSSALVDATRDGNELRLVLHLTYDPNSNHTCTLESPYIGYEAFVRDVSHGQFSAHVVYTTQLQHRTSGGSVTINVP